MFTELSHVIYTMTVCGTNIKLWCPNHIMDTQNTTYYDMYTWCHNIQWTHKIPSHISDVVSIALHSKRKVIGAFSICVNDSKW